MRRVAARSLPVLVAVALSMVCALPTSARSCATLDYLAEIHAADSTLRTDDTAGALQHVRAAEGIDASSALSLAPVVVDLTAKPADEADARLRLDAIDQTLALPKGSTCSVENNDARDALHRVYSSNAFAGLDQTGGTSVLDQIEKAVAQFLTSVGSTLGLGWGLAVLAVMVALIGGLVVWRVRATLAGRTATADADHGVSESNDPALEWRAAMAAAERQDYRQAIRRAFRSALLDVTRRGRLSVDSAWTTRELLASASTDADLLALLAPAAALFDRAWYSRARIDASAWELMKSRCEAIRRLGALRRPEAVG